MMEQGLEDAHAVASSLDPHVVMHGDAYSHCLFDYVQHAQIVDICSKNNSSLHRMFDNDNEDNVDQLVVKEATTMPLVVDGNQ